jgi:hypothetical protein
MGRSNAATLRKRGVPHSGDFVRNDGVEFFEKDPGAGPLGFRINRVPTLAC